MTTTTLLINFDDDYGTITEWEFSVPTQWLRGNIETDIDTFMKEYNPNDSFAFDIYFKALIEEALIEDLVETGVTFDY